MPKTLESILLVILGGFAAICLLLSRGYNPTAALFPQWIAIACLVFLAVLVIRILRGSTRVEAEDNETPAPGFTLRAIFGLEAGYLVLIYLFGFFPTTFL